MSDYVTDEALGAGARAGERWFFTTPGDAHGPDDVPGPDVYWAWRAEGIARAALAAAAPLIAAKALEDAADELHRLDDGRTGGYYDAGRHIIARLRGRAAKLRKADR